MSCAVAIAIIVVVVVVVVIVAGRIATSPPLTRVCAHIRASLEEAEVHHTALRAVDHAGVRQLSAALASEPWKPGLEQLTGDDYGLFPYNP